MKIFSFHYRRKKIMMWWWGNNVVCLYIFRIFLWFNLWIILSFWLIKSKTKFKPSLCGGDFQKFYVDMMPKLCWRNFPILCLHSDRWFERNENNTLIFGCWRKKQDKNFSRNFVFQDHFEWRSNLELQFKVVSICYLSQRIHRILGFNFMPPTS